MTTKIPLPALLLLAALTPSLTACVPALVATGAAATAVSFHDRRTTGTQTDDETSEWKAANRLPADLKARVHANFTAFNRILLITGEAPDEESRAAVGQIAERVEGVRKVHNELVLGPGTSLSSRSNDAFVSSKVKTRLLDAMQSGANHVKPVTENGTLFLMGLVNEREAKAAIDVARTTSGVRKVVNVLEVLSEEETRRLDTARFGSSNSR